MVTKPKRSRGRPRKKAKFGGRRPGLFSGPEFQVPRFSSGRPRGRPRKDQPINKSFSFMPEKNFYQESLPDSDNVSCASAVDGSFVSENVVELDH